mmetsp:Transcript_27863/g.89368  ORF Transcript_27863/g.89368 Transcript_27863/m.89368 type:complete len:204 (+) Transcript_27863:351-962(+)
MLAERVASTGAASRPASPSRSEALRASADPSCRIGTRARSWRRVPWAGRRHGRGSHSLCALPSSCSTPCLPNGRAQEGVGGATPRWAMRRVRWREASLCPSPRGLRRCCPLPRVCRPFRRCLERPYLRARPLTRDLQLRPLFRAQLHICRRSPPRSRSSSGSSSWQPPPAASASMAPTERCRATASQLPAPALPHLLTLGHPA